MINSLAIPSFNVKIIALLSTISCSIIGLYGIWKWKEIVIESCGILLGILFFSGEVVYMPTNKNIPLLFLFMILLISYMELSASSRLFYQIALNIQGKGNQKIKSDLDRVIKLYLRRFFIILIISYLLSLIILNIAITSNFAFTSSLTAFIFAIVVLICIGILATIKRK